MKRKLAYILALCIITSVCIGMVFATNDAYNTPTIVESELTVEDKALQTQIAMYSDTKVDFRYNKQEKLLDETYEIYFSKFNSEYNPTQLTYTNDSGDEFNYKIETGKLVNVVFNSNIVKKTDDSIDINTAHKLALKYFPKDLEINQYTKNIYEEDEDGYVFWYTRYIGKYQTTDAFRIKMSFEGKPIYITYATKLTDAINLSTNKKVSFDEEFITSKIKNFEKENNIENADYDNAIVLTKDGKFYVSIYYETVTDSGAESCFTTDIPLE